MKSFFAILAIALVSLTSVATIQAKPLPANVQAQLSAALKGVDPTNQAAVNQAVLGVIAEFSTIAADITGAAVQSLSASLGNNATAASSVIPALVAAVAQTYPKQAGAIVAAAITSLPANLKADVAAKVVSQSVESVPGTQNKADVITSALEASAGDAALTAAVQGIAQANGFDVNAQGQVTATTVAADDNSGSTQPLAPQTGSPAASGSGSGSGVASGSQPAS